MKYTEISRLEIDNLLTKKGFSEISLNGVSELVYSKRFDKIYKDEVYQISIRIYTTIEYGISRRKGSDAIRVVIFWRSDSGQIKKIKTFNRINRIENWSNNLSKKIIEAESFIINNPIKKCKCGFILVCRENRISNIKFLSCVNFPSCKITMNIN